MVKNLFYLLQYICFYITVPRASIQNVTKNNKSNNHNPNDHTDHEDIIDNPKLNRVISTEGMQGDCINGEMDDYQDDAEQSTSPSVSDMFNSDQITEKNDQLVLATPIGIGEQPQLQHEGLSEIQLEIVLDDTISPRERNKSSRDSKLSVNDCGLSMVVHDHGNGHIATTRSSSRSVRTPKV